MGNHSNLSRAFLELEVEQVLQVVPVGGNHDAGPPFRRPGDGYAPGARIDGEASSRFELQVFFRAILGERRAGKDQRQDSHSSKQQTMLAPHVYPPGLSTIGYYDQGRVRVPACACRSIRRQAVRGVSMALLNSTAEALLAAPCREMHPTLACWLCFPALAGCPH